MNQVVGGKGEGGMLPSKTNSAAF